MPSASEVNSETCAPLVRLVADFNKEDADKDPLLTIARLGNYIPAFNSFIPYKSFGSLAAGSLSLRQDHRDGIPGSNPIEFYDNPLPVQGARDRPWEVLGIQYQRRREQEKGPAPSAPASSPPKASSVQQEGTAAALSAAPAKGQTASSRRPTLQEPWTS